jgi:flagellar export protein FliJ
MKTPYGPLLSLRELEEKQAEARLAEALHDVDHAEAEVSAARGARDAWLYYYLDDTLGTIDATALGTLLARLEAIDRQASRRLEVARRRADDARAALLERRRHREAVESLHADLLKAAARTAARRAQAELDEIGSRTTNARRETSDAR